MGKPTAVPERGIEETLGALGIDTELSAEEAAQDAGEEASTPVEEADTTVEVEETDDGADEEGDEAEEELPPPPASSADVEVMIPTPSSEDAPALIPAPKTARAKTRGRATGAGKMSKGIADKVPGAEKVKVFKVDRGKKWFIDAYTKDDLSNHPDFESFLTQYVKEEHGAGEYVLVGVDSANREMELGTVRLRGGTKAATPDQGAFSIAQELIAQQQTRDADWLKRMEQTMQPQPQQDVLGLLTGVMDLNDRVNGKAGGGADAAAAAAATANTQMLEMMSSSGDKTMQMMMMMQQQQQAAAQQQMQMMMAMFAKPEKEDPVTKLLLAKLLGDGDIGGGGGSALPAPPPPPAQPNMVEMITAIGALLGSMGGDGGGDDEFKTFLQQMLVKQQDEGLSTKEVMQLLMKKDDKPGTDDFRSAVDNMAAIMNISNNMNRQQEGGPAAGLFDALAALFSNRDFAGSIAQTIRAKTDSSSTIENNQLQVARQRAAMQQRLLAQQQGRMAPGQPQPQPGQPQPGQPQPGQPVVTPPPQPQVPLQSVPQPQQTHATQQVAERAPAARQLPQVPANTYEHINALAAAKDEGELVGKTVTLLIYFSEFEDWRPFTEQVLSFARDGNKQGTLEYLHAFFSGLAGIHMIDASLGAKILGAVGAHFEVLQAQLGDFSLEGDGQVTADDLLAGEEGDDDPGEDPGEGDDDPGEDDGDPGEGDDDPGENPEE